MKRILGCLAVLLGLAGVIPNAQAGATLDRVLKEKKLVVGVAPWNRFVAMNPQSQQYEGFIVDDIRNLETLTGIKVEFVNTTWGGLIAGLQAGKWDVVMSGMGATPERAMAVAFSEPFAYISLTAMLRADNKGPQSLADLDKPGNVVSVVTGTGQHKFAQRMLKQAKVAPFADTAAATREVMNGRATAYFGDSVSNAFREKERPNDFRHLVLTGKDTEWNGLNHAVRYDDLDLLTFINTYLRAMKLRGWYVELAEKWGLPPELATGPTR